MLYYFADGDEQKGPFPPESLRAQGLKPDSLVWREGMADWLRADSVPELSSFLGGEVVASQGGAASAGWAPAPMSGAGLDAPPPANTGYAAQPAYPAYPTGNAGYQGQLAYGGYAPAIGPLPTGMSIASMVLGIVSIPMLAFYCFGVLCAIVAIILGHIARGRVRQGAAGGAGMALAGLICGYSAVILTVVSLALAAIFFVVASRGGH